MLCHSSNKITKKNNNQPTLLNNKTPSINNNSSIKSYEIIESISIDSEKINIKDIKSENIAKNFCVGIFIAGLHKNTSNLIENSNGFPACCNHSEYAILQSMTSEILDKYLIKNQKIEINSFFLGIKNCYKCIFTEKGIENTLSSYKILINVINNENNDKFFIVTLQYYRKFSFADFNKFYNVVPLKEYMKKNNEIGEKLTNIEQNRKSLFEIKFINELLKCKGRIIEFYDKNKGKYLYASIVNYYKEYNGEIWCITVDKTTIENENKNSNLKDFDTSISMIIILFFDVLMKI